MRTLSERLQAWWPSTIGDRTARGNTVRPRIRFVGDHATYHCGSRAASAYILREIGRVGIFVRSNDYDVMLVNGEDSMHHDGTGFRKKMEALTSAVHLGKPAMLINAVWQDNSHNYDDVLHSLNSITVRERLSHEQLLQRHGVQSKIFLDTSYFYHDDNEASLVDFNGSIVISDFWSNEMQCFVALRSQLASSLPFVDMRRVGWASLIRSLTTSSLFFTGRHHGVYAACRSRTPFLALSGNTHKIEGLIATSGVPIPVCRSIDELRSKIDWALENRDVYDQLFDWMEAQPPWRLSIDQFENLVT